MQIEEKSYDVVVAGGGAAGVGAALAAAQSGLRTLLVEFGSMIGGDLVSGLPWNGCLNARGEFIVGGVAKQIWDKVSAAGGFAQPVFDWRLINSMCIDPVMAQSVITESMRAAGVDLLLYSYVKSVIGTNGTLSGVVVENIRRSTVVRADWFIDATGDGALAIMAGAPYEKGSPRGEYQPVSIVFRLSGVDGDAYLDFVCRNPDEFLLGESPITRGKSKAECAEGLRAAGYPFAGLNAHAPFLGQAITEGEMFPCTAVYVCPTSMQRKEVSINTTRIANIDASEPENLSQALPALNEQMQKCVAFLQRRVSGFDRASVSGIAARIGIRETARITGEYQLTEEDVLSGRKFDDGIAKGGHHIDIHGDGTYQKREPVRDGNSYDIPYGCIVPKQVANLFVTGRCISGTREAHGSARNMGQCLATGEAAAAAVAVAKELGLRDSREVPIPTLRERLKSHGAILDGTH